MRTTALILGACAVGASARMEAFKPSKVALSSSPRTQKAVLDIRGELADRLTRELPLPARAIGGGGEGTSRTRASPVCSAGAERRPFGRLLANPTVVPAAVRTTSLRI